MSALDKVMSAEEWNGFFRHGVSDDLLQITNSLYEHASDDQRLLIFANLLDEIFPSITDPALLDTVAMVKLRLAMAAKEIEEATL